MLFDTILEWVRLFLHGFCVSLVRPGIVIFLALVLLGMGRGLGLPLLFWRPREKSKRPAAGKTEAAPWPQFLVGIGVGALLWEVLLAGYLFKEFATNCTLDRPPFRVVREDQFDGLELHSTKVPALETHTILGFVFEFPEVDVNFSRRFRYDPLAFTSLWAASYCVASLAEPGGSQTVRRNRNLTEADLFDGVRADFLTPMVHTLVSRDLPSLFSPMHLGSRDRGAILEREWETALHGQLDQTFSAMRPGSPCGSCPGKR